MQDVKKKYASSEFVKLDLSDMFIVNINSCIIIESIDIQFSDADFSVQFADDTACLIKSDNIVCKNSDDSDFIARHTNMFSNVAFSDVIFNEFVLIALFTFISFKTESAKTSFVVSFFSITNSYFLNLFHHSFSAFAYSASTLVPALNSNIAESACSFKKA